MSKIVKFKTTQGMAIKYSHESMTEILTKIQERFYSCGQTDADLDLLNFARNKLQGLEELIRETMRHE